MKKTLRLLALLPLAFSTQAQITNQTFQLHAGWNSIWLELDPTNREIGAVFGTLPVLSAWTYLPQAGAVEFIQDQTEALVNQPGWLAWFPPSQAEAFLTSLFAVHAQRAYLLKLTNAATLTVTGTPVVKPAGWVADSFNLRGFPVNPAAPPAFGAFFAGNPAHAGQRIYKLATNGQWQLVAAGDAMQRGEAYWVFSRGMSTFQGPLGIELNGDTSLDFGTVLNELVPRLKNNSTNSITVAVTDLGRGAGTPLSYQTVAGNQVAWANLPAPYQFTLAPGDTFNLRLAMRRKDFSGASYSSILEVKDNAGSRYLVPVTAAKLGAGRASLNAPSPPVVTGGTLAGLWFGTASITNVNEANSTRPMNVTPTRSAFDLRLLLHVTTNGQPRLLKEVIQMWQPSIFTNDAAGNKVVDKPGRFVLLTDDSLVPNFQGGQLRDGVAVGQRISTVDYDFDGGTNKFLPMSGTFAVSNTASCTLVIEPNLPTNPFKHKFHPDHDNLDALFQPLPAGQEEAYRVTRQIELQFTPADPAGTNRTASALEYGYSVLGGLYRETISGLHRTNLVASGTFRLTRVNNSPVLNQ